MLADITTRTDPKSQLSTPAQPSHNAPRTPHYCHQNSSHSPTANKTMGTIITTSSSRACVYQRDAKFFNFKFSWPYRNNSVHNCSEFIYYPAGINIKHHISVRMSTPGWSMEEDGKVYLAGQCTVQQADFEFMFCILERVTETKSQSRPAVCSNQSVFCRLSLEYLVALKRKPSSCWNP